MCTITSGSVLVCERAKKSEYDDVWCIKQLGGRDTVFIVLDVINTYLLQGRKYFNLVTDKGTLYVVILNDASVTIL